MSGIIGRDPARTDTPGHPLVLAMVNPVICSARNLRKLQRHDIHPDTACAVVTNLALFSQQVPTGKRGRRGGTFLDEALAAKKLPRGGILATSADMKKIMKAKEDAVAEKRRRAAQVKEDRAAATQAKTVARELARIAKEQKKAQVKSKRRGPPKSKGQIAAPVEVVV